MTEGKPAIFKGTTNLFSSGSAMVLLVPKPVLEELKLDVENKKAHFEIFINKRTKEIIYKLIREEDK